MDGYKITLECILQIGDMGVGGGIYEVGYSGYMRWALIGARFLRVYVDACKEQATILHFIYQIASF